MLTEAQCTSFKDRAFAETQWSMVVRAQNRSSGCAAEALERLCQTYWFPLYSYIRRRGCDPQDAQDLVQGFFLHFIERDILRIVDSDKGRFRSFLLVCLKNFLANEYAKASALRRGGDRTIVSFDQEDPESRLASEARHDAPPDTLFDRAWAMTIANDALAQLETEYMRAGKARLFQVLQPYLTGDKDLESYCAVAASIGSTEAAVKMAVVRMRRCYGQLLRARVSETLADPEDLDDEMRHLFAALAS